jgi:hypothetical protein
MVPQVFFWIAIFKRKLPNPMFYGRFDSNTNHETTKKLTVIQIIF